jgi:hypothetical protein
MPKSGLQFTTPEDITASVEPFSVKSLLDSLENENDISSSDEWMDNSFRSSLRKWNHTTDKRKFWPAGDVIDNIPPGLYRCSHEEREDQKELTVPLVL